jgi:type II secretory pathway pseudopilin PulG
VPVGVSTTAAMTSIRDVGHEPAAPKPGVTVLVTARLTKGVVVRKSRRGASLFESLVVLALLLIAAAVVTPTLTSLSGRTPLNAAADTVKARWADARARAVAEGRPYRFAVVEGTGKYRIAPDSPEFWGDGGSAPVNPNDGSPPPLVVEGALDPGIRFSSADAAAQGHNGQPGASSGGGGSGGWSCPVVFLPDGTTQQDVQIAFGGAGDRPLVLRITAATGAYSTSD